MGSASETAALAQSARLFGDLLLMELDAERVAALHEPGTAAALAAVGVTVPAGAGANRDPSGQLDELAAEFHAAFLAPHGGGAPPVASLWTEGRYEGSVAARIRSLAESAAVEFHGEVARGAPIDHLGVLLHLWAATVERAPWVADELASLHLGWASAPLARVADSCSGFYAEVARATASLVAVLEGDAAKAG